MTRVTGPDCAVMCNQHSLSVENEQADARRDGRTRLARLNSQARTSSADHEQGWQPYPVDRYSAICDDHTYIHQHAHFIPKVGVGKRGAY